MSNIPSITMKKHDKTLQKLIELSYEYNNHIIHRPTNFPECFTFITVHELIDLLKILEEENLISVQYADYPDDFNIHYIEITPDGLFYTSKKKYRNKQKWSDRIWGFVTGSLFTVVITLIINALQSIQ